MAKVINHDPLFSTDLKYFKSIQIIEGKTIFDRYNSLANIIKNHIDSQYQDFISYPVNEGNKIEFQGKIANETPHILDELQGNDSIKYQNIKTKAKKGLTLIWPSDFTHTHKGEISNKKHKYI